MRLNILGDDLVNGLCAGSERKEYDGRQYRKEKTDHPGELHKRSHPQIYFHYSPQPNVKWQHPKRKGSKRRTFDYSDETSST